MHAGCEPNAWNAALIPRRQAQRGGQLPAALAPSDCLGVDAGRWLTSGCVLRAAACWLLAAGCSGAGVAVVVPTSWRGAALGIM